MADAIQTRVLGQCGKDINSCKRLLPPVCQGNGTHLRDTASAIKSECSRKIDLRRNDTNLTNRVLLQYNGTSFDQHEHCMRNLYSLSEACLKTNLKKVQCSEKSLQVSKVLRLNMDTLDVILDAMPDLHVIHYVRDPRAVAMSVRKVPEISLVAKPTQDIVLSELSVLCKKMEGDIQTRDLLEKKYPGAFTSLKYEELATKPKAAVQKVYSYLGRNVPRSLWNYLNTALNSKHTPEGAFSHTRRDSAATATAWMKKFPKQNLPKANKMCKTVLSRLGYPTDF